MRRLLLSVFVTAGLALIVLTGISGSSVAATAGGGPCGDLDVVIINGIIACTHGGDAPAPVDATTATATAKILAANPPPPAPCPGNGQGGRRVHVLLGYPKDTTLTGGSAKRTLIRSVIALADRNLDLQSSGVIGQHYRFWCAKDKGVTLTTVQLAPIGGDNAYTFSDVTGSLTSAGYTDPKAIYAVFVANIDCCYPYGGQGTLAVDDQPSAASNANNQPWARFSMLRLVDGGSPEGLAIAFQHEAGHNMGAVQNSAPHSSGSNHCYETNDIMCYNDGGSYFAGGGTLQPNCPGTTATGMYVFDCNGDDYYNVAPDDGSYLADHWDVSRSSWLTAPGVSGK
jgi:hypothetical protein